MAGRSTRERRIFWWARLRRRAFVALVILLATIALLTPPVWWFGSPWLTAYRLRSAASHHDPVTMITLIDMATFRDNLWIDIRAKTFAGLPRVDGRFVDPVEKVQADLDVRETVLRMTEAEQLAQLLSGEETADMPLGATALSSDSWRIEREGIDRFRLRRADDQAGGGDLIFDRFGLSWKLVQIPIARK